MIGPLSNARAQDDRWEVGARFNGVTGGDEPANDILGFGVFGRYRLTDRVSGRTGSLDDYTGLGGTFALSYRF